jgi:outer membrane biosynthesis protein TonB
MPIRSNSPLFRAALALSFALGLASCTKGGQFDPTTVFDTDMFNTKSKLKGDRAPLFPNGVPGTTTGVPPDLVKGYQPPPEADTDATAPAVAEAPKPEPKPKPKPKLKPKPKVAVEKPPSSQPTRIDVGSKQAPMQQQAAPSSTAWPAPQTAQPSQTAWPPPQQTMPASQTGQPSQSVWPNPPAPGKTSQ